MSSATIESPVASSQLFFEWSEQAEVGLTQPQVPHPPIPTAVAREVHQLTPSTSCVAFNRNARVEKTVRMGALMIKLLKRYGITDQEIAEGVASYAKKRQQSMAS